MPGPLAIPYLYVPPPPVDPDTLPPVPMTWTIAGITMDRTPDVNGIVWAASVDGWDAPDIRTAFGGRTADDGDWQGFDYYSGRTLTITGSITAPSLAWLRYARDLLAASLPIRTDVLVISNERPPRMVTGRIAGRLLMRSVNEQQATFSVTLHSGSPYKQGRTQYGTVQLSTVVNGAVFPLVFPLVLAGQVGTALTNPGTAPSRPLLTFHGPAPNPAAMNTRTGQRLAYNITLAAGDLLTVDVDTGAVLLNGSTSRRDAQTYDSQPFELAPGDTTITYTADTFDPGAYLQVDFAPNYL